MTRTLLAMDELTALLLREIRRNLGCEGVRDVSIYHVTDERSGNNWSVGVAACGDADPKTVNRAAIYARIKLARDYDLLTD